MRRNKGFQKFKVTDLYHIWTNSVDDQLFMFFLKFPENRLWPFMQIVSLHEIAKPILWEKYK